MAEVRYVFGNLLSGQVLAEIPMQGVTVSDSVEGGDFQGTFGLDQSGRTNDDLVSATLPGLRYLVVERNTVPFWCGIVWSRTYQSQAKSVQLFAKTMDQYPKRRVIETTLTYSNVEQRNIFRDLWLQMSTASGNTPPFIAPAVQPDTTLKSVTVQPSEMKFYGALMDELAASDDGFEWRVVVTSGDGGYNFNVLVGNPQLGMPAADTSIVFEYPGAILNYWRNDTIGSSGTHVFGLGSGEGDSMPVVEVIHDDLLDNGFPRYDQVLSFKDITTLSTISSLTLKQAKLRKAPMPVYTVEMSGSSVPSFSDWGIGDACKLAIKDPLHTPALTHDTRVLKYEYSPSSADGIEEVRLTFEGDEGD
jgi:hypothetical protein